MSINGLSSITAATDRSGLVLVAKADFSAASAVSVDNCFTSAYDNYRVIVNATGSGGAVSVTIRMRAGGADNTASAYTYQYFNAVNTTLGALRSATGTSMEVMAVDSGGASASIEVFQPALAANTRFTTLHTYGGSLPVVQLDSGTHAVASAFDGFTFATVSGTFTGTLRVYGYRNNV